MKKLLNIIEEIFAVLLAILSGIILILSTPFDYIKYKRSLYYKKEQKKYTLLAGAGEKFDIYNEIAKNELPIRYVENPVDEDLNWGWFAKDKTLIIVNFMPFEYDIKRDKWIFSIENNDAEPKREIMSLDEYIEIELQEKNELSGSTFYKDAVVLTSVDLLLDVEQAKKESRFLIYDRNREEVLCRFCEDKLKIIEGLEDLF